MSSSGELDRVVSKPRGGVVVPNASYSLEVACKSHGNEDLPGDLWQTASSRDNAQTIPVFVLKDVNLLYSCPASVENLDLF